MWDDQQISSSEPIHRQAERFVNANSFILNPEQTSFANGAGQFRARRGSLDLAIGLVWLLLGAALLLTVYGLYEMLYWHELATNGATVDGTVYNRTAESDGEGGAYHTIYYDFNVGRQRYSDEQAVNEWEYDRYSTGSRVEIRYVAANPTISVLAGSDKHTLTPLIVVSGIAGALTTGVLLLRLSLRKGRLLRLEREGRRLLATITEIRGVMDEDDFKVRLTVRFASPSGKIITIKDEYVRNDLNKYTLPTIGARMIVAYLDDRTYQLA